MKSIIKLFLQFCFSNFLQNLLYEFQLVFKKSKINIMHTVKKACFVNIQISVKIYICINNLYICKYLYIWIYLQKYNDIYKNFQNTFSTECIKNSFPCPLLITFCISL